MKNGKDSPVVESVRKARRQIDAECGHDLDKYFEYLKSQEKKDRGLCRAVLRSPPKRKSPAVQKAK